MADPTDNSNRKPAGTWYSFDEIPYNNMWADDILWLPWFCRKQENTEDPMKPVNFEGHFVFDGPPGAASKLTVHNCRKL